jgi:dTDP-4-dehydrorhamnose 3,5-epimerase
MKFENSDLEGIVIISTQKFHDERGLFFESYHKDKFEDFVGYKVEFLQENESSSIKNVIRGLHFQNPPYAQGKLVRVPLGKVLDVVVDIRKDSITYGKHLTIELSSENGKQLWIPAGFAHGFVSLEENSILSYKCTNFYNKASEGAILWNDPILNINWSVENPIVSEKDKNALEFSKFVSQF